ncbi:MAG: tripartite tricarboxylate transporter permease [Armatimonadota bacterium]|nr:tripartite tricarboxylate transporter permease [Armatimonadota bacterium]MDR7468280.1 tripartite tricarboxylate transporter permease [Armatimonadota bacterium]MDR7495035.1 tripartite tricarboxylate transporter permease [Armatimonadota bacterium]MDR7500471.1 tripartite tricarboxylate transporter permease [Armatimonadota bacterium]MDR7505817.1 tripartite tricarboxylate transporter permease [Armatimonadota bacterium]
MIDVWQHLLFGFQVALRPENLGLAFAGALLGTVVGVLPGIGPVGGIAILLPLTFKLPPASAMIMLTAVYYGTMYGGSTTSILMNVPGEASSVVTSFDGYAMAQQGRAGPALAIAAVGSFIAGTLSIIALTFFSPLLAAWGLTFGPPEYFGLMLFGLSAVSSLAGESLVKALLSMGFGLMLATVGTDLVTGVPRFTFNIPYLLDGIDFVVVVIGLFAISEIMLSVEELRGAPRRPVKLERIWLGVRDFLQSFWAIIRGSVIGFYIGILPAAGATIASFLSYSVEKQLARDPSTFGRGDIRGVAAPESANNAAAVGNMIPMLTLGIPGSSTTALMLGALLVLNVVPGPLLFRDHPDVVWGLVASMYVSNLILLILNLPLVGLFVRILSIPQSVLYPLIVAICVIGTYAVNFSAFDLLVMAALGLVAYYMRKNAYPLGPAVLGLVLGDLMEQNLRRSLIMSQTGALIFFTRPITATLIALSVLSLLSPALLRLFRPRPA